MGVDTALSIDVAVFGGGAAGLWLLDGLYRRGYRVLLLEAHALGSGQTIASQGIIHGGLKYTLKGLFTQAADAIKQMPGLWSQCLANQAQPALTNTRLRAPFVYLWHTDSIKSRAGMLGAKSLLRVKPQPVEDNAWPEALAGCAGRVYKLDEQVIDPASFVADLSAQHVDRIFQIDAADGLSFDTSGPGQIQAIQLQHPQATNGGLEIRPRVVVLTAGAGNASLREAMGLSPQAMQRRPLQMVMARGNQLPGFHGHCIDGNRTRVTITSDRDTHGRCVWQIGGQVAEDGVTMQPAELVAHTQKELAAVLGRIDLDSLDWGTYRVDRAEAATGSGVRPDNAQVLHEGHVITGWPTKLALAPILAKQIMDRLDPPTVGQAQGNPPVLTNWPRPSVAPLPWELPQAWI